MKVKVARLIDNGDATMGIISIDGKPICFTLEDEARSVKVKGETRIPEGTYKVVFRKEGTTHAKYTAKYGAKHHGMLHIIDVPNFQYILIHIGNTDEDTDGCLLVGDILNSSFTIASSTSAYEKIYKIISEALLKNENVEIEFVDIQKMIL